MANEEIPEYDSSEWSGEDFATGDGAVGYGDAESDDGDGYIPDLDDTLNESEDVLSEPQPDRPVMPNFTGPDVYAYPPPARTNKRKRREEDKDEAADMLAKPFLGFMNKMWDEYKVIVENMISMLESPEVLAKQRFDRVTEALQQYPELSDEDAIKLEMHILGDRILTETFLNADMNRRQILLRLIREKAL